MKIKLTGQSLEMWRLVEVLFGEMAQHIVILDPEEELGLSLGLTGVWPHFTIHFDDGFDDTFLVQDFVELENLVLYEEEVQVIRWDSREDILGMIDEGLFIPYLKYKINLCFEMVGQYKVHQS